MRRERKLLLTLDEVLKQLTYVKPHFYNTNKFFTGKQNKVVSGIKVWATVIEYDGKLTVLENNWQEIDAYIRGYQYLQFLIPPKEEKL